MHPKGSTSAGTAGIGAGAGTGADKGDEDFCFFLVVFCRDPYHHGT